MSRRRDRAPGHFLAGMTGFEPAVSALTGQRVGPLHYTPERRKVYHMQTNPVKIKASSG